MRCFIAIDIDEEIKKALGNLQQQLADKADTRKGDVKWVRPENVHLTLKFLGEVKDQKIVEICDVIKDVAARHKGFELDLESVGYFGGRSARVLWVGAAAGSDNLRRLADDLARQLALAGWPEEKRQFSSHLTLCRIKRPAAGTRLAAISEDYKDFRLGTVLADSICLYQSQLTPTGPIYTVLGNYKLRES